MSKLKDILSNRTLVTFAAGALFVMLFLKQCNSISELKQDVKLANENAERNFNNYLASKDSVLVLKNENGDLVSTIRSYEFDIDNLRSDQSKLLKKYITQLNLNKDLNSINTLLSAELAIKDSLLAEATATRLDSTTSRVDFESFDDFGNGNTRSLSGSTIIGINPNTLELSPTNSRFTITQTLGLSAAVEEVDGANRLKITTAYPGLEISNIENINLVNTKLNQRPQKRDMWSIGFGVGYGINLNNNQVISTGPSIGIGLYWSPKFLQF
jgi:hypothetical protein